MFDTLTRENVHAIVQIQFEEVVQRLLLQGFKVRATSEAIDWLAQLGYDPQFGARPVKRIIQKQVLNELSKWILSGKLISEKEIVLDCFDNKFVFRQSED